MFHWFSTLTNTRGDALPGWQVECVQVADGQTVVSIFADENGTPIATVSGIADRTVADSEGNYFFFVPSGTYSLRIYNSAGVFQRVQRFVPMYGVDSAGNADSLASNDPGLGASLVGQEGSGTVQDGLDARPTSAALAATGGSDLVGFDRTGTGAVPLSVRDELRALFIRPEQFSTLALADAAAVAVNRPLLLTDGYVISANQTLNADLYFNGGTFNVASGQTLTLRGEIVNKDILEQLFTGNGSVVGLRYARPEWFGAARDGVTDDQPALNGAHFCVQSSALSKGGRPTIELAAGTYGLASTWRVSPTLSCPLKIMGSSWAVGGTRLEVLSSFSASNGDMAFHIEGQTDPIQAIASYEIGGFAIIPLDTTGGGACDCAYQIGSVGKSLLGVQKNVIHDIHVSDGFPVETRLVNVRLINFDRCSWWSRTLAGSVGIDFLADATGPLFCGDINFNECQWVGGQDGSINNTNLRCSPSVAGYEVKGIRFNHSIFYKSDKSVDLSPSAGAIVGDWWFNPGCQFDGFQNNCIYARPVGTGTVFDNININGVYFRGIKAGFNAVDFECDTNARMDAINIRNNWFANIALGSRAIYVNRGSNIHIDFNSLTECDGPTTAMILTANLRSFTIIGNTLRQVSAITVDYLVSLGSGSDYGAVVHNSGNGSTVRGPVQNLSAGTNLTLTPNW